MRNPIRFVTRCCLGAIALAWGVGLLAPGLAPALPGPGPAAVCDAAAQRAAAETGVPLDILRAVTRTETGRRREGRMQPWPWTVNMEGAGRWFDSRAEARAFVAAHQAEGARSFDIGCFQINHRWHGTAFASVDAMFDPLENARYAARFLTRLHEEFEDWERAVGAFHSRTPALAARYLSTFRTHRAALRSDDAPPPAPAPVAAPGPGTSPPTAPRTPGSLVPLGQSPARSLFSGRT